MNSSGKPIDYFFAGSGGIVAPVGSARDSFEALDDLMTVVEGLCPTWPQRDTFENAVGLRL